MSEECPVDAENGFGRLEHLAPTWMKEKSFEVADRHAVFIEKLSYHLTEIFAHQGRELRTQNDTKTVVFDVPSHDVFRIPPSVLAEGEDRGFIAPAACAAAFRRCP